LCGGLIKARLKIRPAMFQSLVDGGPHIVCQDNELGRSTEKAIELAKSAKPGVAVNDKIDVKPGV
jgi:hypothetical protein